MVIELESVRRARDGDREAFGALYDAVAPELYRVALYTLGNPEDAKDAVSETFLEAYKGVAGLRDENSFKPWIMRILSIRCKRRIGGYIKERGNVDIDEFDGACEGGEAGRAELSDALGRLTVAEREILALAVVQGYTMRETAVILGLPQGTVSSKLHRTLKKLREQLSD